MNKILLIGGKNERNFVKRTLATLFADDLASMCSWTGQKNNFKIGDTYTMTAIKNKFIFFNIIYAFIFFCNF